MLAQSVEQLAFNQLVTSSNLVQPTIGTHTVYIGDISIMKKFSYIITAILTCTPFTYAATSANLLDVQNNYQSAKSDADSKQSLVEKATDNVNSAKNDLDKAQKNLEQAQKNLKDAQTALSQKKDALVKANADLNLSNQNLNKAGNAVNQAWQSNGRPTPAAAKQ